MKEFIDIFAKKAKDTLKASGTFNEITVQSSKTVERCASSSAFGFHRAENKWFDVNTLTILLGDFDEVVMNSGSANQCHNHIDSRAWLKACVLRGVYAQINGSNANNKHVSAFVHLFSLVGRVFCNIGYNTCGSVHLRDAWKADEKRGAIQ